MALATVLVPDNVFVNTIKIKSIKEIVNIVFSPATLFDLVFSGQFSFDHSVVAENFPAQKEMLILVYLRF